MEAATIGLTEKELQLVIAILKSNGYVEQAILYGSRAKGNFKPFSDIDISLEGKNLSHSDLADLEDKFYYSSIPYMIDLSVLHELKNPQLIEHIGRVGIKLI